MALTAEQEAEILTRLEAGENPIQITVGMGIRRSELASFRVANSEAVVDARNSKTARLARLNARKARLADSKVEAEARLVDVDAQIAAVEAE